MKIQIEHREAPSTFGAKKHFFVDTRVTFSEAEKAVIYNRQMGPHYIVVDSDIPTFSGVREAGYSGMALRASFFICAVVLFFSMFGVMFFNWNEGWFVLFLVLTIGTYVYRKWGERRFNKSLEERHISVTDLMKGPFTVYAPDAYNAQRAEGAIMLQLQDIKQRLVRVAPELAQQQVYDLGR